MYPSLNLFHANISSHCCSSCRWRETTSLNCGHQRAYCSSPRYMSVKVTVECYQQGKIPNLSNRALSLYSSHLVAKQDVHDKRNAEFFLRSIFSYSWVLTTWDRQLYFPPKEVVLLIFIAFKHPLSSACFEPANFGSNGKHSTTRPPSVTS
jgi:hypothetical protein